MPTITFITAEGKEHAVAAEIGRSVMEIALEKSIPGVVAECNGSAACATCHCYFDPAFTEAIGAIGEHESDMLDFTASPRRPESRLSCQVRVADTLDGMTVRIPAMQ
ncbi:2Fe-2S iron-sulfur cluster-binding protein [Sinorhizobium fredii]|uniref:2Fe-2S iron-sulfur cluster-binding protein n=1 Tax=Rhizobium fredii TaxID=380 RepID=UPI0005956355|nr:2Fe-2S iron-sulfur cluster-binding protein [Sinorhizobium fredii]WOS65330.1 2Fe-2S iron-sulfur cluster-binding protein [Sinorhizobium fredii GR64]